MLTFAEVKQKLAPTLRELGLREQETDIYVHACLLGPSTVAVLSRQLGLSAPNVYKLIARLEEVGLTSFSEQKGYYRKLVVRPPSTLMQLLEERRGDLNKLSDGLQKDMGTLLASFVQGEAPPVCRVLQGEAAFLRATELLFDDAGDEICLVGSLDEFVEAVSPETYSALAQKRIERGIRLRALLRDTDLARDARKKGEKELRDVRFLSEGAPVASMQLTRRKAIVWQPKARVAVVIDDESVVGLWRTMFEGLWKQVM